MFLIRNSEIGIRNCDSLSRHPDAPMRHPERSEGSSYVVALGFVLVCAISAFAAPKSASAYYGDAAFQAILPERSEIADAPRPHSRSEKRAAKRK